MDLNEKDAARSKWRLTKKNQRGRGRGRAVSRSRPHNAPDLGTNLDRYESEDELDDEYKRRQLQQNEGPIRQSLGANLADWIEQFPAQDTSYYAHKLSSLVQDVGLPPVGASSFQGLSFDLKGLAAFFNTHDQVSIDTILQTHEEYGSLDVLTSDEDSSLYSSEGEGDTGKDLVHKEKASFVVESPQADMNHKTEEQKLKVDGNDDAELDALLELGKTKKPDTKIPSQSHEMVKSDTSSFLLDDSDGIKNDSLEDWLDTL